ncbi:MAG: TerD family protein [Jatrophihabitans sp.]
MRFWHDPDMNQMGMGSNIEVVAIAVRASLRWTGGAAVPDIDASAILLGENGQVASDADFVFYNQPQHYSGSVRMSGKTAPPQACDQVDIDLTRVPITVTRIVLAASADGGTFGQVPDLQLILTDLGSEQPIAWFPMQAGLETAFVTAELYRRNGAWRFRAVGQGYAAGLAGLADDFGIDTGHPGGGEPTGPPPPAPDLPPMPPPPLPAAAPTPPPLPEAAPPSPPQMPVSLRKNEATPLVHSGTKALTRVVFSLGWAPAEGRSTIDLDASVIAFDQSGNKLAIVWYMHLNEFSGALQHTGDNRTGGYGDVEQILVDLGRMPANVYSLVFTINSFRGHTFTDVRYASCAVQDVDDGELIARFDLSDTQPSTALLMAELRRDGQGGWHIRAIGEFHDHRTVKKLVPAAARQVKLAL